MSTLEIQFFDLLSDRLGTREAATFVALLDARHPADGASSEAEAAGYPAKGQEIRQLREDVQRLETRLDTGFANQSKWMSL